MKTSEFRLILRHLPFYRSLHDGSRCPATDAQKAFVDVTSGRAASSTPHEEAYLRYINAGRCDGDEEDDRLEAEIREEDRIWAILRAEDEKEAEESMSELERQLSGENLGDDPEEWASIDQREDWGFDAPKDG